MKYALNLPNFGDYADASAMAELAAAAEDAGWDGFFVWDHIVIADSVPVGDPFVILAAAAMATERITIGTLVTPIPRRRPWVLARQAVTLDHLSGGRLIPGVGIGFPPEPEFGTFAETTDAATRGAMLDEGLEVILGIWSGEPFGYNGDHYNVAETTFAPHPVQHPHIPIWVAATWPNRKPILRAAKYQGVVPLADIGGEPGLIDVAGIRSVTEAIARHRETMEGYEVTVPFIPTGDAKVDREAAEAMAEAGGTFAQIGPPAEGQSIDDVRRWVMAGPPS